MFNISMVRKTGKEEAEIIKPEKFAIAVAAMK